MTKDEFEQSYCYRNGLTKEDYDKYQVTLPCNCQYEDCEGWAAVTNSELAIEAHMRLYAHKK